MEKPTFKQLDAYVSARTALQLATQILALLDALPQMTALLHPDGSCLGANRAWRDFFDKDALAKTPRRWLARIYWEDRTRVFEAWRLFLSGKTPAPVECRVIEPNGRSRAVEVRLNAGTPEAPLRMLVATDLSTNVDVSQSLESTLEQQAQMLDASVDCIKLINIDGSLRHMNRSGCVALGVAAENSEFGMPWLNLLPPEISRKGRRALQLARVGRVARFAGKSVINGQRPQYWDNILTPMVAADGGVSGILCVSRDVTEQREVELKLRLASDVDELTGLPNRRTYNRQLRVMVARARERSTVLGLMIIDLDHFKHVNDTLGHAAGDHLLRTFSRRIAGLVPSDALVTRLGGDEFAIILRDVADDDAMLQVARAVSLLSETVVTYAGQSIHCGISIGCALYPRDATDPSGLTRAADTALNDLKASGRGGARMYSRQLMTITELAASERHMVRQVVREGAVMPYYQPKVLLVDGTVVGYEALLRWRRPGEQQWEGGCKLDEAFRDYELASRLANLMHRSVLADMASWQAQGLSLLPVAINAAPVEFLRDDFAERLLEKLREFNIAPALIEIEITEQMLADRGAAFVLRALHKLKVVGVKIALDDFGTGLLSLARVRDYPVECLKIDRSFIGRMIEDPQIQAIVEAVGNLGPRLNFSLVAEGVESETERDMLIAAGYQVGQGFLYNHAVSASEVVEHLARRGRVATRE